MKEKVTIFIDLVESQISREVVPVMFLDWKDSQGYLFYTARLDHDQVTVEGISEATAELMSLLLLTVDKEIITSPIISQM